jgi:metal-dependent hydrolase (beta-lactamase superfamily II)
VLAKNAKAKRVDLKKLDVVVMSHRHMGGIAYLLGVAEGRFRRPVLHSMHRG